MATPHNPPARIALFVYAGIIGLLGTCLILWGPLWLPPGSADPAGPFVHAALLRIGGAVLVALALSAMGLASAADPAVLARGLNWFTGAHFALWVVVATEREAVLGPGLAGWASWLALVLLFSLAYVREAAAASAKRGGSPASGATAKSRYDQAIREAASQEERHRLARDLHDSIKQQIFAIQASAATAETRLEQDRSGVGDALALVRASAREAMTEMEAMLDQLRAAPLDNAGLVAALRKLCDAVGFRTGADVSLVAGSLPADAAVAPGVRPALLRIAQEALANVARHARAAHVTVTLGSAKNGLELSVADDGQGFDQAAAHAGMGLRNIRSRADEVGGRLTVVSRAGAGTTIRVEVPALDAARAGGDEKWKPWRSDILPWALACTVGVVSRQYAPAALATAAAWTLVRAWIDHRSRWQVVP
jgi:signal transduction histidine kinase